MSIATEINKLRDRQESIIQEINNKGVSLPSGSSLASCATAISQIQTGGGGTSFTGHVDRVGLAAIGWTEDDIDFYQAHGVNWNEEDDNLHLVSAENIALYTNATKVTVGGIEMADGSYFNTFKNDVHCRFFPKTDTSSKTSLSFSACNWINAIPKLSASLTSMNYMFGNCHSLTSVDLSGFDTSNVTDMGSTFNYCYSLASLDLSSFDTSKVTKMSYMFGSCYSMTSLDLSGFDTSKVTDMSYMFNNCYVLASLDLSSFDTSKVTNMSGMLTSCNSLASLDLSSFDTSKVTKMSYMLTNCGSLTSLDLSGFDTSSVTDMNSMLGSCVSLTSLDLSSFDTSKVTSMMNMLNGNHSLVNIKFGESFNQDAISSASNALFSASGSQMRALASNDFETVKGLLSVFARTTSSIAFNVYFYSDTTIKDDSDGTLAALKAACEAKGFTISNLTIQSA